MFTIYRIFRSSLRILLNQVIILVHGLAFRSNMQERLCRKEFFYNAFRALSFNGIDGDYVEFGCCGAMTFALAYHEAIRHGHKAKLWAFDSFQGLPAPKEAKDSHPRWVENDMSTALDRFHELCSSQGIPRNSYNVVPGFYNETLSAMSETDGPTNIALASILIAIFIRARKTFLSIFSRASSMV